MEAAARPTDAAPRGLALALCLAAAILSAGLCGTGYAGGFALPAPTAAAADPGWPEH